MSALGRLGRWAATHVLDFKLDELGSTAGAPATQIQPAGLRPTT